jgi:dihydroxyacetone kinase-like protein
MKIMSSVGGSSGVLYGSAYIGAAKTCKNIDALDRTSLCDALDAMVNAMMKRGDSKPGQKTMIDAIYPAVEAYKKALENNLPDAELLSDVKQAAVKGAELTENMEAIRGRACYQANKGVGRLDPGAVTMSYQIETLMDFIQSNLI